MQCYECKIEGRSVEAVGLCRTCSVGLCMRHLQESREYLTGTTWFTCPHTDNHRHRRAAAAKA
ncbi:MAG TPA: DUF2180 family protein [Solirubrobacterales bacterium]|nr:DUF2180 family protein [Solirubrobacterales bacterium]